MEQLLSLLKTIPEYKTMLSALDNSQSVAVTGIGQINRSHMIAGLRIESKRPMVLLCQDDMAARRLQEELKCFLGTAAPILPSRELTLYDAAVVSRAWEQKRLRQLYDLADWVLSTFSSLEEKALAVSLENAAKAALTIIDHSVPEAANRFNGSHP